MKTTTSHYQAVNELLQDDDATWSRQGAHALVDYLEQLEDELGTDIEFDVIAIRCDFSEYDQDEFIDYFGYLVDTEEGLTPEDVANAIMEELENRTTVIVVGDAYSDNRYIVQAF